MCSHWTLPVVNEVCDKLAAMEEGLSFEPLKVCARFLQPVTKVGRDFKYDVR